MRMTIDTAIAIIENPTDYFSKNIEETKHFMIETMYKYQKIEQILKDIPYGGEATVRRIQEVVEDGKID